MDPPNTRSSRHPAGFPRPRGDGPYYVLPAPVGRPVSPPTRGWTRSLRDDLRCGAGFPAHAGMDPIRKEHRHRAYRFPRPRGDGPLYAKRRRARMEVSPPTRGWTDFRVPLDPVAGGFPAHAGMDRSPARPRCCHPGFPRPRGDGPILADGVCGYSGVSPPTRGWTRLQAQSPRDLHGFPAHAGMDRPSGQRTQRPRRFPRPRGDGPCRLLHWVSHSWVSPPTRGWTIPYVTDDPTRHGFPAHAGMDRALLPGSHADQRFPRPRGDGPHRSATSGPCPWFPRPRGDGPRGDLRRAAGMDPAPTCPARSLAGFPRPRGDGP